MGFIEPVENEVVICDTALVGKGIFTPNTWQLLVTQQFLANA